MQGACAAVEASAIRPHEPEAQVEPDDGEDSSEEEDEEGEVDVFSVPVPAAWRCPARYFAAGDGACDCSCGAPDPVRAPAPLAGDRRLTGADPMTPGLPGGLRPPLRVRRGPGVQCRHLRGRADAGPAPTGPQRPPAAAARARAALRPGAPGAAAGGELLDRGRGRGIWRGVARAAQAERGVRVARLRYWCVDSMDVTQPSSRSACTSRPCRRRSV